jgi:hypothetical protein
LTTLTASEEVLLGEGPTGRRTVGIAAKDMELIFRIYAGHDRRRLLLSAVIGPADREADTLRPLNVVNSGVWLSVFAATGDAPGSAEIRWDAGSEWVEVTVARSASERPVTSASLVQALAQASLDGAEYLLVAGTHLPWLSFRQAFKRHVERRYPVIAARTGAAMIFDLRREQQTDRISSG